MNFLENYYNNYDEEGRLLRRHGQVEYLITMHYINHILKEDKAKRILEVGAGTGRYSVTLAKEGYEVDALELIEHNLDILKSKLDGTEKIHAVQGNALDLSRYGDESFDLVLILGPMYHLYTMENRKKALSEAVRVTKKGGHICVAYCMNECVVVQFAFAADNRRINCFEEKTSDSTASISRIFAGCIFLFEYINVLKQKSSFSTFTLSMR